MLSESVARKLYSYAGLSELACTGVVQLAEKLLGPNCLVYAEQELLVELGPRKLRLKRGLTDQELTLSISLGLAMWWLETHPEDGVHSSVEGLALSIAVPPLALREAASRLEHDVDALAEEFVVDHGVVAHRLRHMSLQTHRSGLRTRIHVA